MDSPSSQQKITPHRNTRREARELVLRMLFQIDVGKQPVDQVVEDGLAQSVLEGSYREFAEQVARGTWEHVADLDQNLRELTTDWSADRQPAVDRNILRMTAYEILYRPETPVAAAINEAVELAKKYSTSESGRFVNGVLGGLARSIPRGVDESYVQVDVANDAEQDSHHDGEQCP